MQDSGKPRGKPRGKHDHDYVYGPLWLIRGFKWILKSGILLVESNADSAKLGSRRNTVHEVSTQLVLWTVRV